MIKITNLRVGVDSKQELKSLVARRLNISYADISAVQIIKKSIDARKKNNICLVYAVVVAVQQQDKVLSKHAKDKDIAVFEMAEPLTINCGTEPLSDRPVVVGAGPAGLMAAYMLARYGYKPLLIERGKSVAARSIDVEDFWAGGELDPESNVQFGEGGAGTFSDGKLTTRITDPAIRDILELLVECGAPTEILYKQKPHVGTDVLKVVVSNLSDKIRALGGEILFATRLDDLIINDNKLKAIVLSDGRQLECSCLVLAVGHSARETYQMLQERGVALQNKNLAIGVRIEHTQEFINKMQYGELAGTPILDVADYAVTFQDKEAARGAYSFCMCPGGMVVASSSVKNCVVTNGMSLYKRDNHLANSALVVTVDERDFGSEPLAVMRFQEQYEQAAFVAGGSNYYAPAQSVQSFLRAAEPDLQASFISSYRPGVRAYDLHKLLPETVSNTLRKALMYFEQRMPGFAQDALLIGVETRTSAPVRITRDADTRQSINISGLYPSGEGAGYAGGIISAAADGYNTAVSIIEKYVALEK